MLLLAESGFALHTNRNFGPFISARGGGFYLRATGGELGAAGGAHWLFLRPQRRSHGIVQKARVLPRVVNGHRKQDPRALAHCTVALRKRIKGGPGKAGREIRGLGLLVERLIASQPIN